MRKLALLAALLVISIGPLSADWQFITGGYITGVHFVNDKGWTAESDGRVRYTEDGGSTWTFQTTGVTQRLYGVDFVNENEGWICGDDGVIIHTTDGGQTWVQQWMYDFTSPVTNEVIETWHQDFSAGNGYFVLLPDSGTVDKLWAHLDTRTQATFPRSDTYFMYYRIYGEDQVIAEGFYAGYVGSEPITRTAQREEVPGLMTEQQRKSVVPRR